MKNLKNGGKKIKKKTKQAYYLQHGLILILNLPWETDPVFHCAVINLRINVALKY